MSGNFIKKKTKKARKTYTEILYGGVLYNVIILQHKGL